MTPLDVDVRDAQRVALDEVAARLDLVAHQHREDTIGLERVVELDAQEPAHGRVHRRLPELRRVHLAQALVALARDRAFGLLDQPGHRFAEVADLGFLLALARGALADRIGADPAGGGGAWWAQMGWSGGAGARARGKRRSATS